MNWKKIPYYLPGVGLVTHTIREIKERKGRRPIYNIKDPKDIRALSNYILQTGYLTLAILSKVYIGSYIGKGVSTGNWHPFHFNSKSKIEKIMEKKNNLGKTANYEELLK
jgi:hypothetical protein